MSDDDFLRKIITDGVETAKHLTRLIQLIEEGLPYVAATIGTGCTFDSERRPGWVEIHNGRRRSSERFLQQIVDAAKAAKESLPP